MTAEWAWPEPPPHKVGVRPEGLRTRLRASPSLSTPLLCFFQSGGEITSGGEGGEGGKAARAATAARRRGGEAARRQRRRGGGGGAQRNDSTWRRSATELGKQHRRTTPPLAFIHYHLEW